MKQRLVLLLILALSSVLLVSAQDSSLIAPIGEPEDPNIAISFPPPVYVVRDRVEVRGTANLSNMSNYFIEFRPLAVEPAAPAADGSAPVEPPWFPATLPNTGAVIDNILGEWNTSTAPDGLYEIRLTINVTGGQPQFFRVSPIRIENNVPDFIEVATAVPTQAVVQPRPTLAPSPTAFDSNPRVTALTDSNVRRGDSTAYEVVGALLTGESAPILGVSNSGSGWYYIQLSNGRRGFISPGIVRAEGNLANLGVIAPPFTPTPPATNTPTTVTNLVVNGAALQPAVPTCATAFNVAVDVLNNGSQNTGTTFTVTVTDRHTGSGTTTNTNSTTVPALAPGQNYLVLIPLTVSVYYAEEHQVTIRIDSNNQVPEPNEGDNTRVLTYTLNKGTCG
ncbi:MAG: SH3 domain-containing protein [Anaerolineae bacterium]|nr:SH3 domain-containing protein [Anaerolineae bacterium]